jgi:hypothetical protein
MSNENSSDSSVCAICFDPTNEKILCNHYFHSNCIANWTTNSCPVCRKAIDPNKPITKLNISTIEEDATFAREIFEQLSLSLHDDTPPLRPLGHGSGINLQSLIDSLMTLRFNNNNNLRVSFTGLLYADGNVRIVRDENDSEINWDAIETTSSESDEESDEESNEESDESEYNSDSEESEN